MALDPALLDRLREVVGPARVATDPEVTRGHGVDWTGRFRGLAEAVVAPAGTAEVAGVLAACSQAATPVVPQGGNTGLVGGAVPEAGSVVLDLRRLGSLRVEAAARRVRAGAGVTVAQLHAAAGPFGLRYGVDLASRDAATVGGTVATNAGGLRVLRLGDTRAQLLGVEAVLADGTVLTGPPGLTRDNTGYHLPSLLCGSEGTLAVVTAAVLRLVAQRPVRTVALLALPDLAAAVRAAGVLAGAPFVEAVELVMRPGLELVCQVAGLPMPTRGTHPAHLLVEAAAPAGMPDGLAEAVAAVGELAEAAVATDPGSAARLWAYRERHTEALATLGSAHKLDVTLPAGVLAEFAERATAAVAAARPRARVWLFGHVADGNLHVNITGLDPEDRPVDDLVLRLVLELGGAISSEHGIGRAKRDWLPLARSAAQLALFARLKAAFDPAGLLNPGVLVAPATSPSPPRTRPRGPGSH